MYDRKCRNVTRVLKKKKKITIDILKGVERNYALVSGCSLRLLAVRVMDK